jgi:hypothetical protein
MLGILGVGLISFRYTFFILSAPFPVLGSLSSPLLPYFHRLPFLSLLYSAPILKYIEH